MKQDGISVIETLIIVSIIGLLLAIATINFKQWMVRYYVERQIKEMYSDLTTVRLQAKNRNLVHFVTLSAAQYTAKVDTNDNGINDAADAQIFQKALKFSITWSNLGNPQMQFNKRGLYDDVTTRTICIRSAENSGLAGVNPPFDCLVISQTRINMGKMSDSGGACNSGDTGNCQLR